MNNIYVPTPCVITEKIRETYDTTTYVLEFLDSSQNARFSFYLGQFNMISVLGVGEAPISISSGPGDKGIFHHTVRHVGNVTRALERMEPGDRVYVRGPYGRGWPMNRLYGKDVLIVAGGIGLAPLRPVIRAILAERGRYKKVLVFYGARTPEDLLFKREFDDWDSELDLLVSVDTLNGSEPGRYTVGVVTTLFPRISVTPRLSTVLMCGPEVMMRYAVRDLLELGFSRDQIYLSLERRMNCGIGKCGKCQIGPLFVCRDGPVFSYAELSGMLEPALGGVAK